MWLMVLGYSIKVLKGRLGLGSDKEGGKVGARD